MKIIADIRYSEKEYPITKEGSAPLLDIALPDNAASDTPIVIWFHGGGIDHGSKDGASRKIIEALAEYGIAAASCNYRLYPDGKYPEFIEDAAESVAWIYEHIAEYTGGRGKIFIGGESAGAYLSMMLCFDRSYLLKYGIDPDTEIAGWIHGAGQPTSHFNVLKERGLDPKRIIVDESAPFYHIDRKTFAPMVILTSTNDIKCRLQQLEMLRATLLHWGFDKEIDFRIIEGGHCCYCKAGEDGRIEVVEIMKEFIAKYR